MTFRTGSAEYIYLTATQSLVLGVQFAQQSYGNQSTN